MKAIILSLLMTTTAFAQAPIRLTVDSADRDRSDAPVSVDLPGAKLSSPLHLVETKGDQRIAIPAQLEPSTPPRLHFILTGQTPANTKRTFELASFAITTPSSIPRPGRARSSAAEASSIPSSRPRAWY
jgi:hypothetical protein